MGGGLRLQRAVASLRGTTYLPVRADQGWLQQIGLYSPCLVRADQGWLQQITQLNSCGAWIWFMILWFTNRLFSCVVNMNKWNAVLMHVRNFVLIHHVHPNVWYVWFWFMIRWFTNRLFSCDAMKRIQFTISLDLRNFARDLRRSCISSSRLLAIARPFGVSSSEIQDRLRSLVDTLVH